MKTKCEYMIRTYDELIKLKTFKERFAYLRLNGFVGDETFGADRYVNQKFYHSPEWQKIRDKVILRDNGCDLGLIGHEIFGKVFIHHMNPITITDIEQQTEFLTDPKYLITVSFETHNAIHYGDENLISSAPVERFANDTCPWRKMRMKKVYVVSRYAGDIQANVKAAVNYCRKVIDAGYMPIASHFLIHCNLSSDTCLRRGTHAVPQDLNACALSADA